MTFFYGRHELINAGPHAVGVGNHAGVIRAVERPRLDGDRNRPSPSHADDAFAGDHQQVAALDPGVALASVIRLPGAVEGPEERPGLGLKPGDFRLDRIPKPGRAGQQRRPLGLKATLPGYVEPGPVKIARPSVDFFGHDFSS